MKWVATDSITKGLNAAGVSRSLATVTLMLLFHAPGVPAREVTFAWDANSEPILGGYRLYYGPSSRNYTSVIDVGNQTTYTVYGLADDRMYCVAVTAYDTTKTIESDFSNEVALMPALPIIHQGFFAGPSSKDVVLATDWGCKETIKPPPPPF